MWVFFLCTLALAHGALTEVDCSKDAFEDCESPTLFHYVPTDVSEYNRLCPQLSTFVRCLKDFEDKCNPESSYIFATEEEYNGMYGVFSEICEEGTFLNRIATENLKCFNQTFETTSCPEKIKAITGPYRSPRLDTEDEDDYTLPVDIMCLQDILESNCIAADIGKNCGKEALEATLEFFRRTFYIEETCGKRNAETLLRGLDAFNLEEEQKAIVIAALENVIISAKE